MEEEEEEEEQEEAVVVVVVFATEQRTDINTELSWVRSAGKERRDRWMDGWKGSGTP